MATNSPKEDKLDPTSDIFCELCKTRFPNKLKYIEHLRSCFAKNDKYKCTECTASFAQRSSLLYHLRTHPLKHPFQCKLCTKGFRREIKLRQHLKLQHIDDPGVFFCTRCGQSKIFTSEIEYKAHVNICEKVRPFECMTCDRAFSSNGLLSFHSKSHVIEPKIQCNHCDKRFATEAHLNLHKTSVHQNQRYNCKTCNAAFKMKKTLTAHIARVHLLSSKPNCFVCKTPVMSQKELHKHVVENHRKCDICGFVGNDVEQVFTHRMKHNEVPKLIAKTSWDPIKQVYCNVCGLGYSTLFQIRLHQFGIHEVTANESTYTLNPGHVSFKDRKDNKILGIYNECPICSKAYMLNGYLKRHIETVHGDSAYATQASSVPEERSSEQKITKTRPLADKSGLDGVRKRPGPSADGPSPGYSGSKRSRADISSTQDRVVLKCKLCQTDVLVDRLKSHLQDKHINYFRKRPAYRYISGEKVFNLNTLSDSTAPVDPTRSRQIETRSSIVLQTAQTTAGTRSYDCNKCRRQFDIKEMLDVHMRGHLQQAKNDVTLIDGNKESIACNICKRVVRNTGSALKGQCSHCRNVAPVKNVSFADRSSLTQVVDNLDSDKAAEKIAISSDTGKPEPRSADQHETTTAKDTCLVTQMSSKGQHVRDARDSGSSGHFVLHAAQEPPLDRCPDCKSPFVDSQPKLRCLVCSKDFCQPCSAVSKERYNVLVKIGHFYWRCTSCRPIVPVLTLLDQQLNQFGNVLDSRMTRLEDTLSVIEKQITK